MKEWRYLVFLVKYHLNRWIREKKRGGVFYIGGSDVFPPPLKPEEGWCFWSSWAERRM